VFSEAAHGMNSLAGVQLAAGARMEAMFASNGTDAESLLVAFLSELVYRVENERMAYDQFQVELVQGPGNWSIKVSMSGAPVVSLSKAIKAVTYHNLKIRPTVDGFEVDIVFDV
jgi:SHS2 domain-containing protein